MVSEVIWINISTSDYRFEIERVLNQSTILPNGITCSLLNLTSFVILDSIVVITYTIFRT